MSNEHLSKITENMVFMDGDPATLTERMDARDKAISEVYNTLLAAKPEGEDLSDIERRNAEWSVDYVYRSGGEFHPDDIARHVQVDAEYRQRHMGESGEWVPTTPEEVQELVPYVQMVSKLSYDDRTPAFGASQQGRPHELIDRPEDLYNKYGELVTHLQPRA